VQAADALALLKEEGENMRHARVVLILMFAAGAPAAAAAARECWAPDRWSFEDGWVIPADGPGNPCGLDS
jgi:hypothetical protein